MSNGIVRTRYFERQFLRTQDFVDEQAYHIGMRRRHNIAHHTWGIVYGLQLTEDGGRLFVSPGVAVDGYGRELVLASLQALPLGDFKRQQSNVLEVWLLYGRTASDPAPAGFSGCGDDGDRPAYRWQEGPWVWLKKPEPGLDPRRPEEVAPADWESNPSRTPGDRPDRLWPVFLGQALFDPADSKQPYKVDMAGRPYAGLVGEGIEAPSGRAALEVGLSETDGTNHFAVYVSRTEEPVNPKTARAQLSISQQGEVEIRGHTTLHGDLRVEGGAVELPAVPDPGESHSFQVYHARTHAGTELRIAMPAQDDPAKVVIGYWSKDAGQFQPCLTVERPCKVTVHGDLVVEGSIVEGSRLPTKAGELVKHYRLGALGTGLSGPGIMFQPPLQALSEAAVLRARITQMSHEESANAILTALGSEATLQALGDRLRDMPDLQAKLKAIVGD